MQNGIIVCRLSLIKTYLLANISWQCPFKMCLRRLCETLTVYLCHFSTWCMTHKSWWVEVKCIPSHQRSTSLLLWTCTWILSTCSCTSSRSSLPQKETKVFCFLVWKGPRELGKTSQPSLKTKDLYYGNLKFCCRSENEKSLALLERAP